MEYKKFDKIPRLSRDCCITEKLDGSNEKIAIFTYQEILNSYDYAEVEQADEFIRDYSLAEDLDGDFGVYLFAGSRTRWLNVKNDNYGFARWAQANAISMFGLGRGEHFGEWWGHKIQRTYGLKEKRFSLFNVHKWSDPEVRPDCCGVVPVLYEGEFDTATIHQELYKLALRGSIAVPGYMNPEGIVIYHKHSGRLFKKTIGNDDKPKLNI